MKNYKNLNIKGTVLDKEQLEDYMEKIASDNILMQKSNSNTYPIPKMRENFKVIQNTYELLRRTH